MHENVLDKGFVEIVDRMGSDLRVCEAARVSTGAQADKGNEKNRKLIHFLMKHKHMTPFEKIVFEFHVKAPIFVARQWFRHRMGSFNEASGRYKKMDWETYYPSVWRVQDKKNKQGSTEDTTTSWNSLNQNVLNDVYQTSKDAYNDLLYNGTAKELARLPMPMGHYTEFFWTVNFRSLMNFLFLRTDEHAQLEIRQYAEAIERMLYGIPDLQYTMEIYGKMKTIEQLVGQGVDNIDSFIEHLRGFNLP